MKMLLVGADVVMLASALQRHGRRQIATMLEGIAPWTADHDYASVAQPCGSMGRAKVPNPVAFARANYAQLVTSFVSSYDWRKPNPEGELRA